VTSGESNRAFVPSSERTSPPLAQMNGVNSKTLQPPHWPARVKPCTSPPDSVIRFAAEMISA
jgi:hypothetical protein